MKPKIIVADINILIEEGLHTLNQAAVLIHIGRCGLQGVTVTEISTEMNLAEGTVHGALQVLCEKKLVIRYTRRSTRGRAHHYVCSVRGWELLTRIPDYSLYPDALKAIC